jgi:hypothetical protein
MPSMSRTPHLPDHLLFPQVGARLDRNGLRPARFWRTKDDMIYVASEVCGCGYEMPWVRRLDLCMCGALNIPAVTQRCMQVRSWMQLSWGVGRPLWTNCTTTC